MSTGGIIALGLATLPASLSITRLKEEFLLLATKTFEKRRGGTVITTLDYFKLTSAIFLVLRIWDSVYRTTPLRDGLRRLFGERKLFSAERREVRVAVVSAKDNGADKCLITNVRIFGSFAPFNTCLRRCEHVFIPETSLTSPEAFFYLLKPSEKINANSEILNSTTDKHMQTKIL